MSHSTNKTSQMSLFDPVIIELSKKGHKYAGMYTTIVSWQDRDLSQFNWQVQKTAENLRYAISRREGSMHRIVLARIIGREMKPGECVDHIDGDGLNNRRKNLRLANHATNMRNRRRHANNTSGFKGVSWDKTRNKYIARIWLDNKQIKLGRFDTPEEAYQAYCEAAHKYHGEFARYE